MFITKKALPRRTFLRAMGTTVALPLLDAMVPALSARALKPTPRFGFVYIANGVIQNQWTPATTGAGFELTPIAAAVRQRPRPDQRAQRPLAPAGRHLRRRHRRSSARVGGVAHRRARLRPHAAGRRSEAGDDGRSDDRAARSARRRGFRRSSCRSISRRRAPAIRATASTSTPCRGGTRRRRTPPSRIRAIVFERLFGDGGSAEARQARSAVRGQHPRFGPRRGEPRAPAASAAATRRSWASTSTRSARSSSGFRTPRRSRSTSSCPSGRTDIPTAFDEHTQADVRPAGAGVPGRHHARVQHDHVARAEHDDVRQHRRARAAPRASRTTATIPS